MCEIEAKVIPQELSILMHLLRPRLRITIFPTTQRIPGWSYFCEKNANFSVQGGSFVGNWANLGGGIATDGTVGSTFNGVKILGNEANATASAEGGFAYFNTGSTGSTFVNCVIVGNKSTARHGVYKPEGTTRFVNCSIVGNQSGEYGGVTLLFNADEVVSVSNSIIWENSAISGGHDIYNYQGTASINYSIYDPSKSDGTISGTNNLGSDPLLLMRME